MSAAPEVVTSENSHAAIAAPSRLALWCKHLACFVMPLATLGFVLTGPHVHNFREAARALGEAGGAVPVADAGALAETAARLLADPARRAALGARARAVVEAGRGATARTLGLVEGVLGPAAPAAALEGA